jgi:Ca2+-binding RTX toxin-like protein
MRIYIAVTLGLGLGGMHVGIAEALCHGHRVTIRGHGKTIVGTSKRDVIVGTARSNWIAGLGGRDIVCAGRGDDHVMIGVLGRTAAPAYVALGRGDDYVDGASSGDRLYGKAGDDYLAGQGGFDQLVGGPGNDHLAGATGDDRIRAGSGNDLVTGSSQGDWVRGGGGDDRISTGPGDDRVWGDKGNDELHLLEGDDRGRGGSGDDFVGGFNGDDSLSGGSGHDAGNGGWGIDTNRQFEVWWDLNRRGGEPLIGAPIPDLPPAPARGAVRRLATYKRALHARDSVHTDREVAFMYAKRHQLGSAAVRLVHQRFRHRRQHMAARRARLLRSRDSYRVRELLKGISDQIDRLVIGRLH